jgi:hypothetical protein
MIPLADLVLDFDLYPRRQVDSHHVAAMVEAHHAGVKFPPIVCDEKSKRVTDGFHRVRTFERVFDDPTTKVRVELRAYASDEEMFRDAMRMNASHGRALAAYDRTHCILRAEQLGITPEHIAADLQITTEAIGKLTANRVGELTGRKRNGHARRVPLKRTIAHMSGQRLSKAQVAANDKLGGMQQLFYVNQLITLIENDLLDKGNDGLVEALRKLHGLLDGVLVA